MLLSCSLRRTQIKEFLPVHANDRRIEEIPKELEELR